MLPRVTPEKLAAFCAALAETGIVARACKAVEISRQTAYRWREENPDFAEAWEKALEIGITALEDEAHRRAFEGVEEPIYHQGDRIGSVRKYSDTLSIFLLKAHRPDKYRDNYKIDFTGKLDVNALSEDELDAEIARLATLQGIALKAEAEDNDLV